VVAKDTLHRCDHVVYSQLRRWARRRHPNKNAKWVARRYWEQTPGRKWRFVAREGGETLAELARHDATPIRRHTKVRGTASPFDGELTYWAQRLADHPLTRGEEARLLRRQRGYCPHCGLLFRDGDLREIDHILRKEGGGQETLANKQVLHRHCHDQKTARELREGGPAGGSSDRVPSGEEPGKGKLLRPVLQTSRSREGAA
jgi:RNA-directed DNA polymerase